MEWLKNNAVVVFIVVGLITYMEVRLSDLKADLKTDYQELKADNRELKADNRELKADIREIRTLLVQHMVEHKSTALALKKAGRSARTKSAVTMVHKADPSALQKSQADRQKSKVAMAQKK